MTDINEFPIAGQDNNSENPGKIPEHKPLKKRSRRKIVLGLLLTVVLVVSLVGIGFANKMKHFKDDGPLVFMMEKISEDIDLTPQQKKEVQAIKDEVKAKMESRKNTDHSAAMNDFETAFRQDNLDKSTLESIASKHEADKQEMKSFFEDELIKFHSVLTADQRNKVADKIKDFRENHKDWHNGDKKDAPVNH